MKNYFAFLITLLGLQQIACKKVSSQTIEVSGDSLSKNTKIHIENPQKNSVFFQYFSVVDEASIPYEKELIKDTLTFQQQLPISLVTTDISLNKFIHHTFIINRGEHIFLKKENNLTVATVKGSEIRNNELAFYPAMASVLGNYEGIYVPIPFQKDSPVLRLTKIQKIYKDRCVFFEKYATKHPVSNEFKDKTLKAFYYRQYSDFLYLYIEKDSRKNIFNGMTNILQFIDRMRIDDSACDIPEYANAIQAKTFYLAPTDIPLETYKFAESYFSGTSKDLALYEIIKFSVGNNDSSIDKMTENYLKTDNNSVLTDEIKKYSRMSKSIDREKKSTIANALLYDYKTQKEVVWNDLLMNTNKKLIYIDFWASWCGPCIKEFPTTLKLLSEYQSKDIKFVFISQDKNQNNWEKAIESKRIGREANYLLASGEQSKILKHFKINSIPRYMLIGKDGKVINADAPRPSDHKIRELFDELLKK
ncbi:MAG: TlpA family protein disulfide reductase [Cytophagales bacterium]|nr:MAG: TlpA family protein disulfide reductase [Cytophagales bacterium]